MSKFIDYKATEWSRLEYSDDADLKELITLLKEAKTVQEALEEVVDESLGFEGYDDLPETEVPIEPSDNENAATIELYEDDELLWSNEIENE